MRGTSRQMKTHVCCLHLLIHSYRPDTNSHVHVHKLKPRTKFCALFFLQRACGTFLYFLFFCNCYKCSECFFFRRFYMICWSACDSWSYKFWSEMKLDSYQYVKVMIWSFECNPSVDTNIRLHLCVADSRVTLMQTHSLALLYVVVLQISSESCKFFVNMLLPSS